MTGLFAAAPTEPPAASAAVTVAVASDADATEWDRFVADRADASGYHDWAWRGVFERAFGHEPVYLIARDGSRVAGVLPLVYIKSLAFGRSLTSLPFLNYGGVVAATSVASKALMNRAGDEARARRCRHVELRHVARQFPALPCRQHKVTMRLRLEPGLWERLDRKVRNQIRKAQKSGLSTVCGRPELLDEFYAVFARNMRDLGTPVYGRRFFEEVLRTFPDRAFIHVVRAGGAPVAAAVTFRSGATIEVPWASSIRDFNHMCPNHLLYWHVIETAVADRCGELDFGRSTPNEGTYKFKEQWGASAVPLYWEYRLLDRTSPPDTSPANPRYRFAVAFWKKLPLGVATRLGPALVRGIP